MKPFLMSLLLLTNLISCTSNRGCSDCEPIPPQLVIKPVGGGIKNGFISVGHSVQWEAQLLTYPTPTPLSPDHLTWSATRGAISASGLFLAPNSPTPSSTRDFINAVRNDVPNPRDVDRAGTDVGIVLISSIQSFSSPTPMPVATGAAVTLAFQFADGSAELYTGSTLVQSTLVSGVNVTVHPTATTTFTLKVTNQAGDSVSKDLTVSVQ